MKIRTQFTVPSRGMRDLDYVNKIEVLDKTLKNECQDYPTQEDCLVCCNWLSNNYIFIVIKISPSFDLKDEQ